MKTTQEAGRWPVDTKMPTSRCSGKRGHLRNVYPDWPPLECQPPWEQLFDDHDQPGDQDDLD